jgi:hypothetical protein
MVRDGKTDIADRLRATAEDLVELVAAQVKLVRLELLADARVLGGRIGRLTAFVPLVVLGCGFVGAAIAAALAPLIGLPWALGLVGVVQVGIGTVGVVRVSRSLRNVRLLDHSREELERTVKLDVRPLPPGESPAALAERGRREP